MLVLLYYIYRYITNYIIYYNLWGAIATGLLRSVCMYYFEGLVVCCFSFCTAHAQYSSVAMTPPLYSYDNNVIFLHCIMINTINAHLVTSS